MSLQRSVVLKGLLLISLVNSSNRLYRAKTLFALGKDLVEERDFLNDMATRHQKNYQIWHHRQLIMERIGDPTGETEFTAKMFEKDCKNYHVWSYRLAPALKRMGEIPSRLM